MASFDVHPISRFDARKTSIKRPTEIAFYSVDMERKVSPFSNDQLRYYYPPFFPAQNPEFQRTPQPDLSSGLNNFIKRDDSVNEHLDGLLDTLMEHERRSGRTSLADFIMFRGQMTKIMTAPFDRHSDFEMNATYYQGTIYIEENWSHRADRDQIKQPSHKSESAFTFWGYKFESISTIAKPWANCSRAEIENRDREPVNNITEYCSIVRTGFGDNSLIIAGEVDCVLGEKPDDASNETVPYVELKTSKIIEGRQDALTFENKLCRIWAQSFLLGVPKIVIGWRNRSGFLLKLEDFPTQKIPSKVKREGFHSWDGHVCISFADAFLEFLKRTVVGEGVWRIEYRAGRPAISVRKVEEHGTGKIIKESFKEHRAAMVLTEQQQRLKSVVELL